MLAPSFRDWWPLSKKRRAARAAASALRTGSTNDAGSDAGRDAQLDATGADSHVAESGGAQQAKRNVAAVPSAPRAAGSAKSLHAESTPAAPKKGAAAPQESLSPAEELLIDFLAGHSIDEDSAFESLCAQRAEHASELRALRAHWIELDRVLGARSGPDAPPAGPAAPSVASPGLAARSAPTAGSDVSFDDVLARLSSHSALESRYRVEGEVARGGMGVVYKAWDADLRRHVAMKVLRDERVSVARLSTLQRDRTLARFLEEAQITGQLEHPGIVPVHEIGVDRDGRVFFTMPLVRGRELRDIFELARDRLQGWSVNRVLAVFVKVCEAVAFAHSKGVVHRDLKPSNVMVGVFGEAYVMDWGLARIVDQLRRATGGPGRDAWIETDLRAKLESTPNSPFLTRDGAVIGTPAYMAPEQALGRVQQIGPRSDVYAIGAMLYQLLTGSMPYANTTARLTPQSLLAARLRGPPTPIDELAPDTPPELVAICAKAMAEAPGERYATALELAEDLEAFLGRRPVSAIEPSLGYVVRLAIARNRKAAAAVAAGACLCAGLVARDVWKTHAAAARDAMQVERLGDANERIQRDADLSEAKLLMAEERDLFPATPQRAQAMRDWLARASGVLARAVERRSNANLAGLEAPIGDEFTLFAQLGSYVAVVRDRLALADTLVARTVRARQADWDEAIASITASPAYGGLLLEPQVGLVPLQQNPVSGLWEFWVADTGVEPRIVDAATGALELAPDSALVLVLLPGGEAKLGAPRNDIGRNLAHPPKRDGSVLVDDEDERTVTLAPFFLGKTEVPQSVWLRVMGENPSRFASDELCKFEPWTPLLPVESVSWNAAVEFGRRADFTLPTEAQWEYAAHCGGLEPFAFGPGDDMLSLLGRENLNDSLANTSARPIFPAALLSGDWADMYWSVSPVMTFAANA